MFEIGAGIADITTFKKNVGMMGYGMHYNIVKEIETNLFARAFVIKNPTTQKKVVFVNAEICFITIAVKSGVLKKLTEEHSHFGYTMDNVLLTAQHTHAAPGGYSHYAFYNFSIPGFVPQVYDTIVNGIVEAIVKAEATMQSANVYLNSGVFDTSLEVAFNRSMRAFNSNPEVDKIDENQPHLAVDREMTLLRMDGLHGKQIGMLNWFGVHTTSISNDNTKVCSDNKGYASAYFEADIKRTNKQDDFIAVFAQNVCGDISPNFIWNKKKNWMGGKYEDDFESAKFNGKLQYTKAKEIYEEALKNQPLTNDIDCVLMYVDFSNVVPDKAFTNGKEARTGAGCHGVSFFEGTAEGPGMGAALSLIARGLSKTVKNYELLKANFVSEEEKNKIRSKYSIQGKKDILFETGEAKALGTSSIDKLIIPSWVDKSVGVLKKQYSAGALGKPWTPQILPIQLVIIGDLAIAAFPGEITTVAGWRLRATIQEVLAKRGIKNVMVSCYANAYCGYVTTYEEYQCQQYEGGHTVFGEWTLAAFQTKFKELALQLLEKVENRRTDTGVKPLEFTKEELGKRSFGDA